MKNCRCEKDCICKNRKQYSLKKEIEREEREMRALNPEYWKIMDEYIANP